MKSILGGEAGFQGRERIGEEGGMMGFFDPRGHCITLDTKKTTAASQ